MYILTSFRVKCYAFVKTINSTVNNNKKKTNKTNLFNFEYILILEITNLNENNSYKRKYI